MDGAYRVGGQENFIFEACEYMDSFLDFNPTVAVILNIEMDHVDYFKSIEQVRISFAAFADITGRDGFVVANRDNADVMSSLEKYEGNIITFGIDSDDADFTAHNISNHGGFYCFDIYFKGFFFCRAELSVSGYHNIYNSLATCAVAHIAEFPRLYLGRISGSAARAEGWKRRECSEEPRFMTTTVTTRPK